MSDSQALFALIAGGVLALVQCFFGFRLQKFLIALVGFFIGFLAGLIAHRSGNISLGRDVLGASVGSVT